jgi:hypothetical protein
MKRKEQEERPRKSYVKPNMTKHIAASRVAGSASPSIYCGSYVTTRSLCGSYSADYTYYH